MQPPDHSVKIELTLAQQRQIASVSGQKLPSVELSLLHLAFLVLSATATGSQTLAYSDSAETRKYMLQGEPQGAQNSGLFLIDLELTEEQREQIRKLTGRCMSSLMIAPDELPVTYYENWGAATDLLRIGKSFVVVQAGREACLQPTDHGIVLAPEGSAAAVFGVGAHPTTQLSLILLEENIEIGDRVLDFGTGSGILAVAAARLGAREVLALDIDPAATAAARATIAANNLTSVVNVGQGGVEVVMGAQYDVVVANLFPQVIIALAEDLAQMVLPSGVLITSGIVTARAQNVIDALSNAGLRLESQRSLQGWEALVLCK